MKTTNLLLIFILHINLLLTQNVYDNSQGKIVGKKIAPYLVKFCKNNSINYNKLINLILKPTNPDNKRNLFYNTDFNDYISSDKYITGNWTNFLAHTQLIYQFDIIDSLTYTILFSKYPPAALLSGSDYSWSIALINKNLDIVQKTEFRTKWKYEIIDLAM